MFINTLHQKELLTLYYRGRNFVICRVADWSIMAICTVGDHHDDGSDWGYHTYNAWHLDLEFAREIMKNNAVFTARMLSKATAKEPDLVISENDAFTVLSELREEVNSGKRQQRIDPVLEKELKSVHMSQLESYVQQYGNPPVFTHRKFWVIMLSFFLYPFGLPWFMAGQRRQGSIILASMLIGCVVGTFFWPVLIPVMAYAVGSVFVFYFKLVFKGIEDENGRVIITKKSQKRIAREIERYNQYKQELGETVL